MRGARVGVLGEREFGKSLLLPTLPFGEIPL